MYNGGKCCSSVPQFIGAPLTCPRRRSELAPPGIRGSLVALQQLAITFGIFISWVDRVRSVYTTSSGLTSCFLPSSYWIGYGTQYIGGTGEGQSTAAWRIPLAIQLVPAIVLCGGSLFLPFSPRWLMLKGRQEECLLTLASLRDLEPEHISIQGEFMALQAERLTEIELVKERYGVEKTTGRIALKEYWRLISTKSLLHRLSLGVAAQSLQQWSGINAIIYYGESDRHKGLPAE
jgi:hypothetical protein